MKDDSMYVSRRKEKQIGRQDKREASVDSIPLTYSFTGIRDEHE